MWNMIYEYDIDVMYRVYRVWLYREFQKLQKMNRRGMKYIIPIIPITAVDQGRGAYGTPGDRQCGIDLCLCG